jgi:hypothetical protein
MYSTGGLPFYWPPYVYGRLLESHQAYHTVAYDEGLGSTGEYAIDRN